jgi:hypothetical protein
VGALRAWPTTTEVDDVSNVDESDSPEDEEGLDVIAFEGPEDEDWGPRPQTEVDDVSNVDESDGPEDEEGLDVIAFEGPEDED